MTLDVNSLHAHYDNAGSTEEPSHHSCFNCSSREQKKDMNVNPDVDLQFQTFMSQTTKLRKDVLPF